MFYKIVAQSFSNDLHSQICLNLQGIYHQIISPQERHELSVDLKFPAFVMQVISECANISPTAKQSLQNSASVILKETSSVADFLSLEARNPESFLILPLNAIKHVFCGVIRRLDKQAFSIVVINSGSASGQKVTILNPPHLAGTTWPAMYQEFIFSGADHLPALFDPQKENMTVAQKYKDLADKSCKQYVLKLWEDPRQKVMACYAIQPFTAIVYALNTLSDTDNWTPLRLPEGTILEDIVVLKKERQLLRETYTAYLFQNYPNLQKDIQNIVDRHHTNKLFRASLAQGKSVEEALTENNLEFSDLTVDTLKQCWGKLIEISDIKQKIIDSNPDYQRKPEIIYALDFHIFKPSETRESKLKSLEIWKQLAPNDPFPWVHQLCLTHAEDTLLKQANAHLSHCMDNQNYAGIASKARALHLGINAAMPGYSKPILGELSEGCKTHYPELSLLISPNTKPDEDLLCVVKSKLEPKKYIAFKDTLDKIYNGRS
jgi:hypothetical protein